MFMRAQEVVIGNPESQVVVGTVDAVKAVCVAVGSLVGAVEPFDHLLERSVFRGNSVVVGKSDDLCDLEGKGFAELFGKLHGGEGIGTVAVSDELELFREFCKSPEGHAHGKDARADAAAVGHLVADDGPGGGVHDEPDVGFDAADFDIGFISGKYFPFFVGVLIDKGLDADGGSLAVVGYLLVGDADVVQVFQGLRGFAEGKAQIACSVRHKDMTWALCLLNLREEAFLGRVFRSMLKKSIINSR